VVYIHGGGFVSGDKSYGTTKCQMLADSGFVAVTINYRLGWDDGGAVPCSGDTTTLHFALYRALQDVNAALRFLVAHAAGYHIDPNWVFVAGSSAGGAAALMSTYINDSYASWRYPKEFQQLGSLATADNSLTNAYTVKGICSVSGCTEDSLLINSAKAVPAILFHGQLDHVVPFDFGPYEYCDNYPELFGSECLYRRLAATNTPAVLHLDPNGGHGAGGESGWGNDFMMSNTSCFFHAIMRKSASSQTGIYMGLGVASCQ
jgi:poly(3-hydroxybutyrate) depolymerase